MNFRNQIPVVKTLTFGWAMASMTLLIQTSCSKVDWPEELTPSAHRDSAPDERGYDETRIESASIETGPEGLTRSPASPDVSFMGLAAGDLRQHTTASEGADFDPDVDAAGQSVVFASTRHSKNSHLYIKSVNGSTLTQITDGPFNDTQPAFDPTGRRIAFASDRGGSWDIWLVDIDGRNPVQITNSTSAELHPSWAPDGRLIAYCRIDAAGDRNTIWIADLEQPGIRRLVSEGSFPVWSPKGNKIAFQRAKARGSRWFSVWTIDLSGDEVLYPTEVASQNSAALISPDWSPDGDFLTFSVVNEMASGGQLNAEIGIVGIDGRGMRRLPTGDGDKYSPDWGGDGRIYYSNRTASAETIWSVKPLTRSPFESSPSATTPNTRRAVLHEDMDVGD